MILGAGLRLFDLTDSPIDFHPTRQLHGAIIARGIYYNLLPNADPAQRRLAVDFWNSIGQYDPSILETLTALGKIATGADLIVLARIINTIFWLIGSLAVFALARRLAGPREASSARLTPPDIGALVALAYMLVLPFSVQASRSFQPDPGMTMWLALFAYAVYRWSETRAWKFALIAGVCGGLAIFTKAVMLYTVVVVDVSIVLFTVGQRLKAQENSPEGGRSLAAWLRGWLTGVFLSPQIWVMVFLTALPVFLFFLGRQGRATDYFDNWTLALSHLLLEPIFYLDWAGMAQGLLNPVAMLFGLAGIWLAGGRYWSPGPHKAIGREQVLLGGLWLGYFIYGLILPYQMDTHSYYHLQLVPIVALSLAPSVAALMAFANRFFTGGAKGRPAASATTEPGAENQRPIRLRRFGPWALALLGLGLLAWYSWQALIPLYSQDYHNEPAYWQEIASHLPENGKIVALTQDYGFRIMYYGWRKVSLWPNRGEIKLSNLRGVSKEFEDLFAKRTQGKDYFLITSFRQFNDQPDLKQWLESKYPVVAKRPGYIIYGLR